MAVEEPRHSLEESVAAPTQSKNSSQSLDVKTSMFLRFCKSLSKINTRQLHLLHAGFVESNYQTNCASKEWNESTFMLRINRFGEATFINKTQTALSKQQTWPRFCTWMFSAIRTHQHLDKITSSPGRMALGTEKHKHKTLTFHICGHFSPFTRTVLTEIT